MGKKKGGKKKGSGKKGSKKARSSATDDAVPDAADRFVQFQIDDRAAECARLQDERDTLGEENGQLEAELAALVARGQEVMGRIQSMDARAKAAVDTESALSAERVNAATEALASARVTSEAEIAALRARADELETTLGAAKEHRDSLETHRQGQMAAWADKIERLKRRREELVESHKADAAHLDRQFEQTRERFVKVLASKIDNTKAAASEAAVTIQPVPDRISFQDHGWLSYELEEQRQEYMRLLAVCSDLEDENRRLQQRVLTAGGSGRRIPPSSIGLRMRPASRQNAPPPRLRGVGLDRPVDPKFASDAHELQLFERLALSSSKGRGFELKRAAGLSRHAAMTHVGAPSSTRRGAAMTPAGGQRARRSSEQHVRKLPSLPAAHRRPQTEQGARGRGGRTVQIGAV